MFSEFPLLESDGVGGNLWPSHESLNTRWGAWDGLPRNSNSNLQQEGSWVFCRIFSARGPGEQRHKPRRHGSGPQPLGLPPCPSVSWIAGRIPLRRDHLVATGTPWPFKRSTGLPSNGPCPLPIKPSRPSNRPCPPCGHGLQGARCQAPVGRFENRHQTVSRMRLHQVVPLLGYVVDPDGPAGLPKSIRASDTPVSGHPGRQ